MNETISDITINNAPTILGNWIFGYFAFAFGAVIGGTITATIEKKLAPIVALISGVFGYGIWLIIKIMLQI